MSTWWLPHFFDLIEGLAWPVILFVIVYMFRKNIAEYIDNIRIKYKDIEIYKSIAEAEDIIEQNPEYSDIKEKKSDSDVDPKLLFLNSWITFEKISNKYIRNDIDNSESALGNLYKFNNKNYIYDQLLKNNIFSKEDYLILNNLRKIRNKIVHGEDVYISNDNLTTFSIVLSNLTEKILNNLN